ncbi:cupin domain-containing protein [Pseudomonas sp. GCM10022186]|uniref:cupin domain-containing protein n=1 Tax=Pseudomonas sp. GCM10022186 TaxID=3252650 RepID=UPI00360A804C
MRYIQLFATAAAIAALSGLVQAGEAGQANASWKNGIHRTDLVKQEIHAHGHEVIQARVDIDPGVASPRHSHPGEEVAYVISGTFEYQLEDREPVILKAGDSLFIPDGVPHVAKNVGEEKASELATYTVRKGEPLLKLEQ